MGVGFRSDLVKSASFCVTMHVGESLGFLEIAGKNYVASEALSAVILVIYDVMP